MLKNFMLKNFWYACEFSAEITNKPKQVLIFNQRFVLYRNFQGQIIALNDQCPHRGAAFSLGWIEKDCLRCPYHGWKFQADGQCIEIPSNAPGTPIPKKARVDNYPIQEKYGFVWLFYGDLPEAQRPPLPTFPEDMVSTMRPVYDHSIDNANYARLMEANLDFTHVIAVHKKSFGQRIPINKTIKYQVEKYDWGAVAKVNYESLGNAKNFLNFLLGGRPELKTKLTLYLPNVTLAEISVGRGSRFDIKFGILVAHLPIDENKTRVKRVLYRNVLPLPWLDGFFRNIDHKLAQEDTVVVSTLTSQSIPKISDELHVAADALDITFRQFLQKHQAGFPLSQHNQQQHSIHPSKLMF
ncbi:aromatic ring-hydroxylating dioxygenase subunit alpha [Umezakia ovalisporum]|jgi:phenylpropionate dioxygenase-like ring-hydroxylating dioxygenase large terminal subunit|uniref:Aromatic ring-hydroxylating dioxygenase subunit alpha n=1 Tax=Umezakia ovalisporum FSS-43 TaxID=2740520 RepID=A0ABT6JYN0_9CYAN|nr:aromatic ring-hydroxylating dioxygenase subunit alpha [Umezakia ovalisporum]MDH6055263.1 aromatic ring-hydroxylating dioxygenase subunit alpha [Umezakia ovalisporum FSS-43]MDH6066634.1 aromatic ring-hydroxylating dioxygenase subunit alpha [Umezakia ovalisporum APH033B]MDH6071782.1 aromatic ring-hydroxylating dioxygenase subunit alpha [Umezakia ovalisporum CobakiLakeA]MDH6072815.1 aromatic ring-hydroxylating dioxygenase subunit alpha [Umezakia ovalisporum CS-1034]MDH6077054.1 aromatic ring-h